VGQMSVVGQPTRPTQPFILTGLINESVTSPVKLSDASFWPRNWSSAGAVSVLHSDCSFAPWRTTGKGRCGVVGR